MPVAASLRRWIIPALALATLAGALLFRARPEPVAAARATSPAARPALPEVTVSDAGVPEAVGDGAWAHAARGADFRCGPTGVEVEVPAGALRISTRELRIGDRVLYREGAEVRPNLAADKAIVYRRSADLEERFLPRPAGMEQLWVLDKDVDALKGAGDLHIRVALETSLEARPHAVDDGSQAVRFYSSEGEAVLEYGAATAVDAEGKTRKLDYRLESGELHMALNAGWLAQASFPLTIDPVVGTPITVDNNAPVSSVRPLDVAYNATNNQWLVTWSENNDIAIRIMNADGTFTGNRRRIAGGAAAQVEPAVSWNAATNRYLVVYSNLGNGNGAIRTIIGQILLADGSTWGNRFPISNVLLRNRRHPDVAASGAEWLVTWDEETTPTNLDVFARMVPASYDPTLNLASTQFPVATLVASNELTPAVANLNGAGTWMLLWEEAGAIKGRTTNDIGTLGTLRTFGSSPASWPDLATGPSGTCLAVWNSSVLGNNDVYAVPVGADGLMQATAPRALTAATADQLYPKAAYSSTVGQYFVTWQQQAATVSNLYGARLWANGGQVTGSEGAVDGFAPPTSTPDDRYPAIAWNSTPSLNQMLIVYRSNTSTPFLINAERFSMIYDGPTNPTSPAQNKTTGGNLVAAGGYTNELTLNLSATASDPTPFTTFKLQFQVRPVGTAMTYPLVPVIDNDIFFESLSSTDNASQSLGRTVTGLVNATSYHWLARAVDDGGLASSWVEFPLPANASNPPTSPAAADFSVDTVPPTISISGPSVPLTRIGPVSYTVTYGGADSVTLSAANITLITSGTATGTITVSVVDPVTRTVTISPTSGDGTLGISIVAGTASDLAGNLAPASAPSALFTVDNSPPTITIDPPVPVATSSAPVIYTVNYTGADAVTLANGNVTLIPTGTAAGTINVTGSGNLSRTVTITSISGFGTLAISLAASTASDTAGNFAAAAGPSTPVSVDNVAPLISIGLPSQSLTRGGPVDFLITYTGANTVTLAPGDVILNSSLTATGVVSILNPGTATPTVRIDTITGNGPLGISIAPNTASDLAGNFALGAGPSTTFMVDNIAPTISISAPSALVTRNANVTFTVTYGGASNITLNPLNITLIKTSTANGSVGVAVTNPTSALVTISGITGDGFLGISIAAGTAIDPAGNLAPAAGPSGTFEVDNTGPTVTISAPSALVTRNADVTFTVTYGGASNITLNPLNITLNKTSTANGNVGVTITNPTSALVTISGITGDGFLGISIGAGTAVDAVNNPALAAGPSGTFEVDNTAPTITISAPSALVTTNANVTFTVTYGGASNITLNPLNITLNKTSTANGSVGVTITNPTSALVTISGITGDGFLGISIAAGTAIDPAGNLAPAAGPSGTFEVDNSAPTISISAPSALQTTNADVTFTVTYGGASNITLSPAMVTLHKTSTANGIVSVAITNPTSALVTISGITGDGTLGISIALGSAVDPANNGAPAAGPSGTFTVDNTAPTILISAPSPTVTTTGNITFTISYGGADSVTLVDANVTVIGLSATATVTGSGNSTRTVTLSGVSGNGTLAISIASGTASDTAGNQAPAAGPSAAATVDNLPPTILISGPSVPTTATGPVTYTVTYTGASSITLSTVTLQSVGSAAGSVGVVVTNPTSALVTISGITGDGILRILIPAGSAVDAAGNLAPAAGPSAAVVVDDPDSNILAPSTLRVNGAVNPTAVTDTPAFTAIHNWSGGTPLAAGAFQLQVSDSTPFGTVTHWNSPPQTIFPGAVLVTAGTACPDLRYSFGGNLALPVEVPLLSWNTAYSWQVKFWDSNGAASGFSTEAATFRMVAPSVVASAGGNGSPTLTGWRMIGFPIPVGSAVKCSQLLDDGAQVLRLNEPTRAWVVVGSTEDLQGGQSYFLWAAPTAVVDLTLGQVSLGGQKLDLSYTSLPVPTGLEITEGLGADAYAGAHMIANPFNRTINWRDPGNGGQVEKLNLKPTYHRWDGTQYLIYNSQTNSGTAGPLIPPFQGFGVYIASDNGSATDVIIHDSFFAPSLAPRRSLARQSLPSEAWTLQLVAESGAARDTENLAGVHPDAEDTWDLRDSEEPGPGPDLFVLVTFEHGDWPTNPRGYTHDIRRSRSQPGEEVSWTLTVRANTGSPVRLSWPNLGEIPSADWSLSLEDPDSGLVVDLGKTPWLDLPALTAPRTLVLHATRLSAGGGDPAPTPDPVQPAGAGGDDGRCGLLGVECLLILAALRRRRSPLAATLESR